MESTGQQQQQQQPPQQTSAQQTGAQQTPAGDNWTFDNFQSLHFGPAGTAGLVKRYEALPEDQRKQIASSKEHYGRFLQDQVDKTFQDADEFHNFRSKKQAALIEKQTKFVEGFKTIAPEVWGADAEKIMEKMNNEAKNPSEMFKLFMDMSGKFEEVRGLKRNAGSLTTFANHGEQAVHAASATAAQQAQRQRHNFPVPSIPAASTGTALVNGIMDLL
jgi:hypothetical protein